MDLLRRLHSGGKSSDRTGAPQVAPTEPDASERDYELDLLRSEQARLDDLMQRQLRYARYAWQPPAQGGERRADDEDETATSR
jgi:hypothetical protein